MRKIKFRGHAVEEMLGGQWVYGFGVEEIECTQIYTEKTGRKNNVYLHTDYGLILVHEKSFGQYTGLKDKNGVEIYEGDLIKFWSGSESEEDAQISVVKWWVDEENNYPAFDLDHNMISNYYFESNVLSELSEWCVDFYVIGNIYENPELLEGLE